MINLLENLHQLMTIINYYINVADILITSNSSSTQLVKELTMTPKRLGQLNKLIEFLVMIMGHWDLTKFYRVDCHEPIAHPTSLSGLRTGTHRLSLRS